jgi:hypothetical protein
VKALRNGAIAIGTAVLAAFVIRVRGTGGVPPRRGGWRELPPDELG